LPWRRFRLVQPAMSPSPARLDRRFEQWLEDLDRKIKSNPISRGILELVFILVIIAMILWAL
ncbi:MAG: hypothetical protein AABY16_03270, partial [Nanoarchaeota archaeon]